MIFAAPTRLPIGTAPSFALPAPPVDVSFSWAALAPPEPSAAFPPAFQGLLPEPPWAAAPAEMPLGVIALPPAAPGPLDSAPPPPAEAWPADPSAVSPIISDPPAPPGPPADPAPLLPPIPGSLPLVLLPHHLIALPDPVRPPADPAALLLPFLAAPPFPAAPPDPALLALTLLDGLWAAAPLPEWPGLPTPPAPPPPLAGWML